MTDSPAERIPDPAADPIASPAAHIRSFVVRAGRCSPAQTRALVEGMPRWGIDYAPARLDYAAVFGRQAPCILEIGCGMGETTARIAAAQPAHDFIGIEVHPPGLGSLLKLIDERALNNLRLIRHDAVEVVRDMIPPGTLAGIHVFFPDPWPKKRHHKRRLLQAPFVEQLALRLAPGGYIHCATDWQDYAEQMDAVLSGCALLKNTAAPGAAFVPRPAWRPQTKFETRGLKLGHGVWDLVFIRHNP